MSTDLPHNDTSQFTLFVKRIGLVGVAQIIFSLKGLIILPILTKTLGASDYGIWAQTLVTVSLLKPIVTLGLGHATVRFLSSKGKGEISQGIFTALSVALFIGIIAALVVSLLSRFLAGSLLGEESAAAAIRLGSLLIILEALNEISIGSFRLFSQIKRYSIIIFSQTVLEIGLLAFLVLSGYGIRGAIISLLVTKGIIFLITLYLIISHAGFAFPNFSLLRPYLAYSLPLIPTLIFAFVVASSDRYIIGFYLGAASVGIYSAAYGIGNMVSIFIGYIAYILAPTIFDLFDRGSIDEVKVYLSYSWKYAMMLLIPSAFGVSILAEPLLETLTAVEFVSTGRFIIPMVALSAIFFATYELFGQIVRISKRTGIFAVVLGAAALLNLGLNILLVPHWGIMAAAGTTVVAYALTAIIMYYQAGKYVKFDLKLGFIIKSIISAITMSAVIWAFSPDGIVEIVISIVIGAIIYFTILFLLRGFNRNEIQFFFNSFKETVCRMLLKR